MGHEIIEYRDRHEIFNDWDLWAIRHFMLLEAQSGGEVSSAEFLQSWQWIGPGVWLGLDFDGFLGGEVQREEQFTRMLLAAERRIASFGEEVPLDYCVKELNIPSAVYLTSQSTVRWIEELEMLRRLLTTDRP